MDDYLTAKEVAAKVKLTLQTIRRYTMLRQIPFHKINRSVRYKTSEIENWVEERENKKKSKGANLFDQSKTAQQAKEI